MTMLIPYANPEPDPVEPIFGDKTIVTVDNTTSGVVAVPTGTTEHDRLVLAIAKTEAATFTGLTGWTETVAEESVPGAMLYMFEKEAGFTQIGTGLSVSTVTHPAIAALSSTQIAYIDGTNDQLRTYDFDGETWTLTGTPLTISGAIENALCALSSTRVVRIDFGAQVLQAYDLSAGAWSAVGNPFSISGTGFPALAKLSATRIAFIDGVNESLRAYDFDGADWTLTGNAFAISGTGSPALAALSSTRVAFVDGSHDELRAYDFNGTDWTLTGNALAISGLTEPRLCALSATRVILADNDDTFRAYDFDDTDWTLQGSASVSGIDYPALATLDGTTFAFIDGLNDELRAYGFDLGATYTPAWTGVDDAVIYMINVDQCNTSGAVGSDHTLEGVSVLIHCDGVDAATTFTDSGPTGHTITAVGNAQVDTAQKVFGTGSVLLDGDGDYLSVPDHADFDLGTSDFAIDFRARFSSAPGNAVFVSKFKTTGNQASWALWLNNGTSFTFMYTTNGSSAFTNSVSWSPVVDTWYHVRVQRVSGLLYFYVDGSQVGSSSSLTANIFNSSTAVRIGGWEYSDLSSVYFPGWMDEVLIRKGTAFASSSFTPPSAAYDALTTAPTCPSVTTGSANNLVLRAFAAAGASITQDVGEPAGSTVIAVRSSPNSEVSLGLAYEAAATAGDVAAGAFTLTAAQPWAAATVALRAGDENSVASYVARAVIFDGTNDYLSRGAGLTGAADGKVGIFFAPVSLNGGDGAGQRFFHMSTACGIARLATNKIRFHMYNSDGTTAAFECNSDTYTVVDDNAYHLLLIAWDAATSTLQVYDGDTSVTMLAGTRNNVTIDYTASDCAVGGVVTDGSEKLNANVGPVYINLAETLDISVEANRRKFFSAGGAIADMGSDGSTPTGTAPIIFFDGAVATWHTNKGSGGGFTENGELTDGGVI